MHKLLIANRGEIALRIARAAEDLGIATAAVYSRDDAASAHVRRVGEAIALARDGAAAYLDVEGIVAAAERSACDAVHPGYGFLSESSRLVRAVEASGRIFVGPTAETLEILGDKSRARELASTCGVPVPRGSQGAVDAAGAAAFLADLGAAGAMMIKAVAGGGGRGMRLVRRSEEVAEAWERCRSEARQAFGDGAVYCEEYVAGARHVEVQVLGDGSGRVVPLGERECSVQRRHQKLIELAPCPSLRPEIRQHLTEAAVRLAQAVRLRNAATFEFLVRDADFAFIEANPRLQVEHTVTEEVLALDLVELQLRLAAGRSLADLGLDPASPPQPRGHAIQIRINTETMASDGSARPAGGTLTAFEPPLGPGVRVDTCAHVGWRTNPGFDSLLAKVVAHSTAADFGETVRRARRALAELRIEGVSTNLGFARAVVAHGDFAANRIDTEFVDRHLAELVPAATSAAPAEAGAATRSGARVDAGDPLAVLAYGKDPSVATTAAGADTPVARRIEMDAGGLEDAVLVEAAMPGTIVSVEVCEGEGVRRGQALLVMSAMKMEHVVEAPASGVVQRLVVAAGDTVAEGSALLLIEERDVALAESEEVLDADPAHVRADLMEVHRRHELLRDGARPEAVGRRRKTGQRTARENIDDLCDPESFVEYGGLAIAAQRQRRTVEDLIERTPADGLVAGVGRVNGDLFGEQRSRCVVMSYDYTVLAGTQGFLNHRKKDRMFELAERLRLPVVFFTEGGGGRPGDTDAPGVASLDCMAFHLFGRLSGLVPLVGINSGRCFAGNAALLGCCDAIIATANSNIGMGGPAMIEGGGLGVFRPEEVGPMAAQVPNGVVDVAVADEAEAVRVARRYLSYFQGATPRWQYGDPRRLRSVVPENRLRVYEMRSVIEALADQDSVLELRRDFGLGMITAFIRVEGRPLGVIANNPRHLAGAIDSPAADKAARFMQLCDAFDIPILFLCDTPGMMVGPEVEKTALVRHCSRMFVVGANLDVPFFTIVVRKSYGLGAQAMGGGSHKAPLFTVSWPTGEFGGMGLEGAVKLGFRKELAAIADPEERRRAFAHMVARAYEHGKALNTATHFEIDDVIDPADSRRWIVGLLDSVPPPPPRTHKKRPCVDTW